MFLFIVFAAIVWYGLYSHRRTWWALVWWICALLVLVAVAIFHAWLNVYYRGTIYMPVMRAVLYPYSVFVLFIGTICACLPKHFPGRPCPKCKYDVTGLAEDGKFTCPECNTVHAFAFVENAPCRLCGASLSGTLREPDVQCWRCNTLYVVNAEARGLVPPQAPEPLKA